eukprot:5429290-Alexandrium_andersonii.AAC.1
MPLQLGAWKGAKSGVLRGLSGKSLKARSSSLTASPSVAVPGCALIRAWQAEALSRARGDASGSVPRSRSGMQGRMFG